MNQILVSEKLYVTPELKKKKKLYKFNFITSIFLVIILFSYYVYAEYDRNRDEEISEDILSSIMQQKDETTISSIKNALVVRITQDVTEELENEETEIIEEAENQLQMATATSTYTAPNGKKYETVGVVTIPKLNITYPILSKTTDALMKVSACKFHGANPNEIGNLCVIAHNYRRKGNA